MLEETTRIHLMYDMYGPLLKERQRQYFELYYRDDLSLGEIAELQNISRQAVFEQVKRVAKMLEEYESKLGLLGRYEKRQTLLTELKEELCQAGSGDSRACEITRKLLALEMEID
ncbi:YlxM family DNA-binding protein [Aneurinibacillus uraniidurans]|uniref:YlxM family DNA-binding protein n=1 Tax=Aneurinibacillus uraniidurans TaxID=2966586 RepID=UPI0023490C41|nr:YlxM family DNA-binding protein [Aneurinibacillus sp. B1]WCN39063.1 YlxM family DNA-binding protein [Aneurinibacillus sp. B1]